MGKNIFSNLNKKHLQKIKLNPKNWGLNIQKREYQDIVESHINRPDKNYKNF